MDAIAAALCVPVPFVLRHVASHHQATLLLEVRVPRACRRPCALVAVPHARKTSPRVCAPLRRRGRCHPAR
jgi:hypothetical protein